jgi:hypothetical protein
LYDINDVTASLVAALPHRAIPGIIIRHDTGVAESQHAGSLAGLASMEIEAPTEMRGRQLSDEQARARQGAEGRNHDQATAAGIAKSQAVAIRLPLGESVMKLTMIGLVAERTAEPLAGPVCGAEAAPPSPSLFQTS